MLHMKLGLKKKKGKSPNLRNLEKTIQLTLKG